MEKYFLKSTPGFYKKNDSCKTNMSYTPYLLSFILAIILCCASCFVSAQNFIWAKGSEGNGYSSPAASCMDNNSNIYTAGSFKGDTLTFGTHTLTNNGFANAFLTKYDSNGNVQWCFSPTAPSDDCFISGITADSNSDVYIIGFYASTSITLGSFVLTNNSGDAMFICKLSGNGVPLWAQSIDGIFTDFMTSITSDNNNNIIICGAFQSQTLSFGGQTINHTGSNLINDVFVVKYNSSGVCLWAKSEGTASDEYCNDVTADLLGNIYIVGGFSGPSIAFGTHTLTQTGFDDVFVTKYNSSGNVVWAKSISGTQHETGNTISADLNGNVYVAGSFLSPSLNFGNITLPGSTCSYHKAYISKFDPSGTCLWAKGASDFDPAMSYFSAAFANSLGVSVTGGLNYALNISSYTIIPPGNHQSCLFIMSFDGSGNVLCDGNFYAGGSGCDIFLAGSNNGYHYATGNFTTPQINLGTLTTSLSGTSDVFTTKMQCTTTGMFNPEEKKDQLVVVPNPNNGTFNIKGYQDAVIYITDALGRIISSAVLNSRNSYSLQVDNLAPGVYFLSGADVATKKLIVQ